MTPVLMKVGLWDPTRYEAPLQYEARGGVMYVRSCLVNELVRQIEEDRYVVKPLGDIIRRSSLDSDRKLELSEITESYRTYKNQCLKLTPVMLGKLFLEIVGCGNLFDIIPVQGLYSDKALNAEIQGMDEEEQGKLCGRILRRAQIWLMQIENAMEQYVSVEPEARRCALKYMLGVMGEEGEDVDSVFGQLYNLLMWGEIG